MLKCIFVYYIILKSTYINLHNNNIKNTHKSKTYLNKIKEFFFFLKNVK